MNNPTLEGFRIAIPALDAASDSQVLFYLKLAAKSLNHTRWDDLYEEGCYFFAAHFLSLDMLAQKSVDGTGGIAASAGATVSTSKTVGSVSISETKGGTAGNSFVEAGDYNQTTYGQRYYRMVQIVGAGGAVV